MATAQDKINQLEEEKARLSQLKQKDFSEFVTLSVKSSGISLAGMTSIFFQIQKSRKKITDVRTASDWSKCGSRSFHPVSPLKIMQPIDGLIYEKNKGGSLRIDKSGKKIPKKDPDTGQPLSIIIDAFVEHAYDVIDTDMITKKLYSHPNYLGRSVKLNEKFQKFVADRLEIEISRQTLANPSKYDSKNAKILIDQKIKGINFYYELMERACEHLIPRHEILTLKLKRLKLADRKMIAALFAQSVFAMFGVDYKRAVSPCDASKNPDTFNSNLKFALDLRKIFLTAIDYDMLVNDSWRENLSETRYLDYKEEKAASTNIFPQVEDSETVDARNPVFDDFSSMSDQDMLGIFFDIADPEISERFKRDLLKKYDSIEHFLNGVEDAGKSAQMKKLIDNVRTLSRFMGKYSGGNLVRNGRMDLKADNPSLSFLVTCCALGSRNKFLVFHLDEKKKTTYFTTHDVQDNINTTTLDIMIDGRERNTKWYVFVERGCVDPAYIDKIEQKIASFEIFKVAKRVKLLEK